MKIKDLDNTHEIQDILNDYNDYIENDLKI